MFLHGSPSRFSKHGGRGGRAQRAQRGGGCLGGASRVPTGQVESSVRKKGPAPRRGYQESRCCQDAGRTRLAEILQPWVRWPRQCDPQGDLSPGGAQEFGAIEGLGGGLAVCFPSCQPVAVPTEDAPSLGSEVP